MLGLPASDIPRPLKGEVANISMVDIRSVDKEGGREMTMSSSTRLVNNTHGLAIRLTSTNAFSSIKTTQHSGSDTRTQNSENDAQLGISSKSTPLIECGLLRHERATALTAFWESQTYACDLPRHVADNLAYSTSERDQNINVLLFQVDIFLTPKQSTSRPTPNQQHPDQSKGPFISSIPVHNGAVRLNPAHHPFYISNDGTGVTSGLFSSASRRLVEGPFSWEYEAPSMPENNTESDFGKNGKISSCLIGVDYVSPQHREVIQYHLSLGFDHIYLGLPLWPHLNTSNSIASKRNKTNSTFNTNLIENIFRRTWENLRDFIDEGNLSLIVSEYAADFIQPTRFWNKTFTYAPHRHKSSFVNTCLLIARNVGDRMVFIGDMDELVEHNYGSQMNISQVVQHQLHLNHTHLDDTCAINLGSVAGLFHENTTGFQSTGRIAEKLSGVTSHTERPDSVKYYGKSILNARRVLRAGVHSAAFCESLPTPYRLWNQTRPSSLRISNVFRPNEIGFAVLRTLHLTDSYALRSTQKDLKAAMKEGLVSFYARDWSDLVNTELSLREKIRMMS